MSALIDRIASVARSKGVSDQAVVDALVAACKASIGKAYGTDLDVEVGFTDGRLEAFAFKEVIPDDWSVVNSDRQIHLSQARKYDTDVTLEDEYGIPLSVESLERKACEPGQLEKLFDRYGGNNREPKISVPAVTAPKAAPPEPSTGGPPTECVQKGSRLVEVPFKDTRSKSQIVADLQREVDEWKERMVSQFAEKIETYAQGLRELIEVNLAKDNRNERPG